MADLEVDAVDGLGHRAALATGRVVHPDVLQLEQWRVARSLGCRGLRARRIARAVQRGHGAPTTGAGTSTHAARRPSSPAGRSATSVTAHSSRGVGAAGVERAARRHGHRVGGISGQPGRREARRRVTDGREGAGERPGVRVAGVAQQGLGRSFLDDAARVHHRQPLGDGGQHREVVGDEDHGQPALGLDPRQEGEHLGLDHHVERGRGLVGDQEAGIAGEGHGDHHALLLAAGELVGVVAGSPRRQADQLQEAARRRALDLVGLDGLGDLVADALHRVERVLRALEHDRRARPADGPQPAGLHGQHVVAVEEDLAFGRRARRQQPEQGHGHRRLAATGLARHAHRLALVHVEADPAHGRHAPTRAAVGDVEVADRQDGARPVRAHRRPLPAARAVRSLNRCPLPAARAVRSLRSLTGTPAGRRGEGRGSARAPARPG